MVRRALAGVVGAFLGLLPLGLLNVVVGALARAGQPALSANQVLLLGATVMIGGVLLGGGVAGWIAGRNAGLAAGGTAGVVAALLYAGALIGAILLGAARGHQGLSYVQVHPLRASAAILLVASAIVVVSLFASLIVRPPLDSTGAAAAAPSTAYSRPVSPRYAPRSPQPRGYTARSSSAARSRDQVSVPRSRQSHSSPRYRR